MKNQNQPGNEAQPHEFEPDIAGLEPHRCRRLECGARSTAAIHDTSKGNEAQPSRASLLLLADCQMWVVIQNGRQIDVHAQVIPDGEKARDITVISNAPLECANLIVTEHNRSLLARNSYLPNQSSISLAALLPSEKVRSQNARKNNANR